MVYFNDSNPSAPETGDVCEKCRPCKEYGCDHSYHPGLSGSGIQTSIDIIFSELPLVGLMTPGKRGKKGRRYLIDN
jgi:hypothetical protein